MKADPSSKNRWFVTFLIPALLAARGLTAAPAGGVNPVKDLARAADYVFRGTVVATGAANLAIVEPDAATAVVRVDEVLTANGSLDDFTGREITVFLGEPLTAGDQRVFFTTVRLLGESLGVQEVGRDAGDAADVTARVHTAKLELRRENLAARLAAADLVVSGRVLSTRAKRSLPEEGPLTEHDPQWREAVLQVTSVLQGKVGQKTVTFSYPASFDVMWAQVPKPIAGREGTWLLHRHVPENGVAVYAAIDPGDLLSADETKDAAELTRVPPTRVPR